MGYFEKEGEDTYTLEYKETFKIFYPKS